jgi:hypothetical protein
MTYDDSRHQPEPSSTRGFTIGLIAIGVLLLGGLVAGIWYLLQPTAPTESLRDILLILVAFEFFIIGLALVLLVVQLARLVNLLQNELKPILDSANQTANTVRGTSLFLSDKLVGPVVKISAGVAGFRRALDLLKLWRK